MNSECRRRWGHRSSVFLRWNSAWNGDAVVKAMAPSQGEKQLRCPPTCCAFPWLTALALHVPSFERHFLVSCSLLLQTFFCVWEASSACAVFREKRIKPSSSRSNKTPYNLVTPLTLCSQRLCHQGDEDLSLPHQTLSEAVILCMFFYFMAVTAVWKEAWGRGGMKESEREGSETVVGSELCEALGWKSIRHFSAALMLAGWLWKTVCDGKYLGTTLQTILARF